MVEIQLEVIENGKFSFGTVFVCEKTGQGLCISQVTFRVLLGQAAGSSGHDFEQIENLIFFCCDGVIGGSSVFVKVVLFDVNAQGVVFEAFDREQLEGSGGENLSAAVGPGAVPGCFSFVDGKLDFSEDGEERGGGEAGEREGGESGGGGGGASEGPEGGGGGGGMWCDDAGPEEAPDVVVEPGAVVEVEDEADGAGESIGPGDGGELCVEGGVEGDEGAAEEVVCG